MVLSIYVSIIIILLLILTILNMRLHLFEKLFIWMVVWLITHTTSSIMIVNLELYKVAKKMEFVINHQIERLFLFPLIILIGFGLIVMFKRFTVFFLLLLIMTLTIEEVISFKIGTLEKASDFSHIYSMTENTVTVLASYILWVLFRKILFKKDDQNAYITK